MGNYIDTGATRQAPPRPCSCPITTPHEADTAEVRERLGYGELATFRAAGWARSSGAFFVNEDAKAALIVLGTVRWSLVLPNGKPRPITTAEVELLDEPTIDWLYKALEPAIRQEPLPNGSGDPSPDGSPAKRSRTRTTRTPPTSTTG